MQFFFAHFQVFRKFPIVSLKFDTPSNLLYIMLRTQCQTASAAPEFNSNLHRIAVVSFLFIFMASNISKFIFGRTDERFETYVVHMYFDKILQANLFQKQDFQKSEYPQFCQLFGLFLKIFCSM